MRRVKRLNPAFIDPSVSSSIKEWQIQHRGQVRMSMALGDDLNINTTYFSKCHTKNTHYSLATSAQIQSKVTFLLERNKTQSIKQS